MNDHVGKPFDLEHLVRVLRQQAGWSGAGDGDTTPQAPSLTDAVTHAAAAAGVDIQAALQRLGGKQDVYQRMLRTFVTDLAAMPGQLRAAATPHDTAPALRLLHTLKGLAATLGATALCTQAARAEKQMATHPAKVADTTAHACQAMEAALPGLQNLQQTLQAEQAAAQPVGAPTHAPLDGPAVQAALQTLANDLASADMQALQSMAELQQHFGAALGQDLAPLGQAIGDLNFQKEIRVKNQP